MVQREVVMRMETGKTLVRPAKAAIGALKVNQRCRPHKFSHPSCARQRLVTSAPLLSDGAGQSFELSLCTSQSAQPCLEELTGLLVL